MVPCLADLADALDTKWIYNLRMIIRWLLALIFTIMSVTTPVGATCAMNFSNAQQCCCHKDEQDTACTMRDTCCTDEPETPGSVKGPQVGWHPSECRIVVNVPGPYEAVENSLTNRKHLAAIHLATNKLYLKKRALLI